MEVPRSSAVDARWRRRRDRAEGREGSGGAGGLPSATRSLGILQVSPPPVCILDEVDAALDEANVERFRSALREAAQHTQFIIITHNRGTIEAADTIYGISMGTDSVSQALSLQLDDLEEA